MTVLSRFLGDGRSKVEKLESLLSIPEKLQAVERQGECETEGEASESEAEVSVIEAPLEPPAPRPTHPFIRAILKREKSEEVAKEMLAAHRLVSKYLGELAVHRLSESKSSLFMPQTYLLGSRKPQNYFCVYS